MDKRLLLILNPCAGQKRANRFLPEIIRLLTDRGYECTVYVTACQGDATRHLVAHAKEFDRIVCIGGDGTLNETVEGVAEAGADCPIGYIPAGTTNDYAGSLSLSSDIMQAAADAVDGTIYEFDLGSFNGRKFIYTASCGAFAKASYSTPQFAKNVLGHLAYILEGIRDLPSVKPIHLRAVCDDRTLEGDYLFCSVTNSLSVGGILKLDRDMVCLNDGLFEVMLVKNPTSPAELTQILAALKSANLPCDRIEFLSARSLRIIAGEDVEWTLDGERGDCGREFEIINLPRKMRLVLPRAAANVPAEAPDAE